MSMPQIPEEKYRPTLCEAIIDIIKSIALEETALSHIMNAEGERTQALIKKFECSCSDEKYCELASSIKQTEKIINTIIMKEWLLLKKLETAYEIQTGLMPVKPCENCRQECRTGRHNCCNNKNCNQSSESGCELGDKKCNR